MQWEYTEWKGEMDQSTVKSWKPQHAFSVPDRKVDKLEEVYMIWIALPDKDIMRKEKCRLQSLFK
jgi:hypothetical protein